MLYLYTVGRTDAACSGQDITVTDSVEIALQHLATVYNVQRNDQLILLLFIHKIVVKIIQQINKTGLCGNISTKCL